VCSIARSRQDDATEARKPPVSHGHWFVSGSPDEVVGHVKLPPFKTMRCTFLESMVVVVPAVTCTCIHKTCCCTKSAPWQVPGYSRVLTGRAAQGDGPKTRRATSQLLRLSSLVLYGCVPQICTTELTSLQTASTVMRATKLHLQRGSIVGFMPGSYVPGHVHRDQDTDDEALQRHKRVLSACVAAQFGMPSLQAIMTHPYEGRQAAPCHQQHNLKNLMVHVRLADPAIELRRLPAPR
jgi:hypothetical protein